MAWILEDIGGHLRPEKDTKRESGHRVLHPGATLHDELRRHREPQLAHWRDDMDLDAPDLVIATRLGTPVQPGNFYRAHRRLLEAAGIEAGGPHQIRHAQISYALSAGVPLADVSRASGHANPNVTAGFYAHALRSSSRRVTDAVERLLNPLRRATSGGPVPGRTRSVRARGGGRR